MGWADKKVVLKAGVVENGKTTMNEIAIGYGKLIEVIVDFLIISLTVFAVVKLMNTLRKKAENTKDKTVTTPKDIELLRVCLNFC